MDVQEYIESICKKVKMASVDLRPATAGMKNRALDRIAELIGGRADEIREANRKDLENAERAGLSGAFIDRLALNEARLGAMVDSLRGIASLEDPVGEVVGVRRPQGFLLERVRVPIGVVAMIYESRPNVTVDAAALCLKSGNGVVLRGGKEAIASNLALAGVIREGLQDAGLPEEAVQLVERTEHEGVGALVRQDRYVDLIIPRGGESLIRRVVDESTIPVIKHYRGVCHLFVDEGADLDMAEEVVWNAKVQRPATCNALETLLIHRAVSEDFLPRIAEKLRGVRIRGCPRTKAKLPEVEDACDDDYYAEYLDMILAVKVVDSLDEAIEHIEKYGSSHTDGILSSSRERIERFVRLVDSAVLTVNASTRLSDGGIFGLGAEIGISTDKLHARGPMGIRELTTYKWVVRGRGDVRL